MYRFSLCNNKWITPMMIIMLQQEIWPKISRQHLRMKHSAMLHVNPTIIAPNKRQTWKELWNLRLIANELCMYDGVEGGKTRVYNKSRQGTCNIYRNGEEIRNDVVDCVLMDMNYMKTRSNVKLICGFNNYQYYSLFKTMEMVLQDDPYGFLTTGNKLSPYKIPLNHLKDVTVMLEKTNLLLILHINARANIL